MKLVNKTVESVTLELTNQEFNFLREALRELPRTLHEQEIPTLTGFTREQVFTLADVMGNIAADIELDL